MTCFCMSCLLMYDSVYFLTEVYSFMGFQDSVNQRANNCTYNFLTAFCWFSKLFLPIKKPSTARALTCQNVVSSEANLVFDFLGDEKPT